MRETKIFISGPNQAIFKSQKKEKTTKKRWSVPQCVDQSDSIGGKETADLIIVWGSGARRFSSKSYAWVFVDT